MADIAARSSRRSYRVATKKERAKSTFPRLWASHLRLFHIANCVINVEFHQSQAFKDIRADAHA